MSQQPMRRRTLLSALAAGAAAATTGVALPAQARGKHCNAAKTGPVTVAYIEVNDHSMLSAGKYTLANGGAQVIDVAVIFAANINYDGSNAYLSFNQQVQSVLDNVATQVRPLQQKGIKVLLSILGNHQGAGFANFPSQAAADAFAQQLADAVNQYGLDGIDFDDEYAEYGNNGTGQPNDFSFVYLVQALRAEAPEQADHALRHRPRRGPPHLQRPEHRQHVRLRLEPVLRHLGRPERPDLEVPPLAGRRVIHRDELVHRGYPRPTDGQRGVRRLPHLQPHRVGHLVVHVGFHAEALRQRDRLQALAATGWPAATAGHPFSQRL